MNNENKLMIVALFVARVIMLYNAKIPKRGSLSMLGILAYSVVLDFHFR